MSKKIIGNMSVAKNTTSYGKNTIRDVNNVNADSNGNVNLSFYTKGDFDKKLAALPISRVGSLDYLPMSISGSFESSTTYNSKTIFPNLIEDDGTMVYLRPGTDGITYGYYYTYVQDARNVEVLNPISTNSEYRPIFFTENHKLIDFVSSNTGEILMMRTNNGTDDTYTLALTNGTMNIVSHQFVEFNRSLIPNTNPQYIMICNNIVYIWCIDSFNNSDAFSVSLYTLTVSDIRNGVTTSLSRITGFNGKTLYKDTVSSGTSILLSNMIVSNISGDKPFILSEPEIEVDAFNLNTDSVIHAAPNEDHTSIRIAVSHAYDASTKNTSLGQKVWGFSFTYDVSTKQYSFDSTNVAPIEITSDESGIISGGSQFDIQMENLNADSTSTLGNASSIFQTNDGVVFSVTQKLSNSYQYKLTRSKISNYKSLYDSWNLSTRVLYSKVINTVNSTYGSAVGENIINPQIISKNKILFSCSGTYNDVSYDYDNVVSTELGEDRTYTYKSLSGVDISGYEPNVNRMLVANNGYNAFNALITIIDQDDTTSVYGSSFIEGSTKPANGKLDPDTMQFLDKYTLQNTSILATLKTDIISSVTLPDDVIDSKIVLYFIPDDSLSKSIAVVSVMTDGEQYNSYILTSEVDVVLSGKVITSSSVLSTFTNEREIYCTNISLSNLSRMNGLTISKYSDFTFVGLNSLFEFNTTDESVYSSFVGKISNNSKRISSELTLVKGSVIWSKNNSYQIGAIPGVGFGLYEYGEGTDLGTKLIFKNFGTSSADFDLMISDLDAEVDERFVVAAQEIAQEFTVHFTQKIPVLLGGKYYEIAPTNIDLLSIDDSPQNKSFYIYIIIKDGNVEYLVSTDILSEELDRVFIGTIITGSSSISTINTEKVTRFLTYRTSTTKCGSAIPVSTGVPSGTGTRWH